MAGAPALHDVWFCVTEGTGKITLGERGREENNVLAGDWAAQCCGEPVYGRKHPGFAEPGAGFTGPAFDGAVRPRLSALYGSRDGIEGLIQGCSVIRKEIPGASRLTSLLQAALLFPLIPDERKKRGARRHPFFRTSRKRIRNGVRRCRCLPGLPCQAAGSSRHLGSNTYTALSCWLRSYFCSLSLFFWCLKVPVVSMACSLMRRKTGMA